MRRDGTTRETRRNAAVGALIALIIVAGAVVAMARMGNSPHPAADVPGPPLPTPTESFGPAALAALTKDVPCALDDTSKRVPIGDLGHFVPVAIVGCTVGDRRYADGEWAVTIRRATTVAVTTVVNAMRADAPPTGPDCDGALWGQPNFELVNATGAHVLPRDRRDGCDVPIGLNAIEHLTWQQQLSVRKLRLLRSAAEIAERRSHPPENLDGEGPPSPS